ncbi:DUF3885 domain-containing protein [Paenibacillus agaridevorans]|uniref:DUF3885 domain-containing protein n=1 Tax=Paenibacillus agaridevorans TaxID=171404 RepID=UPI001BE3D206|nr:DUF3885 domain-containing protein [Paenibacillus agaridevorans]
MSIQEYIDECLSDIQFEPPLFYNSKFGIHFELGLPYSWIDDETYFKIVKERAQSLFSAIFKESSSMYVLYVSFETLEPLDAYIEGEVDFSTTFFYESTKSDVEEFKVEEVYDEETNELFGYTKSYGVLCTLEDIDYKSILGVLGGFSNEDGMFISGRVYFIEPKSNIVYHIYDNRGLDVVSPNKESIFYLYREFNQWILNYDKEQIDKTFSGMS